MPARTDGGRGAPKAGAPVPAARTHSGERLAAIRTGEAEVFGQLYLEHGRQIYAFCGRRSGDWTTAEDLSSMVFLEAWRTREGAFLTQDESAAPWLLGIARHVVPMSWRSRRRYAAALDRFAAEAGASAADDVQEEALRSADLERVGAAVRAALGRLNSAQRSVAELCLLGELTPAQAAAVLRINASLVESRLQSARSTLIRLLRSRDVSEPSWLLGNGEGGRRTRGTAEPAEGGRS